MKTKLIIVRHAEAEGNVERVFHGWTDSNITKKGHLQAKLVAERLKDINIDSIYSSNLQRCLQTASYISNVKGLPIIKTEQLREINGGKWENMPWDILPVKWPNEYYLWENMPHLHKMPGGESMIEFQKRIVDAFLNIINTQQGKVVCAVTHGTAIKSAICYFYGKSLEEMKNMPWYDNTAVTVVEYAENNFNILIEGDVSHLDNQMKTIENQQWWIEMKNRQYKRGDESIDFGI